MRLQTSISGRCHTTFSDARWTWDSLNALRESLSQTLTTFCSPIMKVKHSLRYVLATIFMLVVDVFECEASTPSSHSRCRAASSALMDADVGWWTPSSTTTRLYNRSVKYNIYVYQNLSPHLLPPAPVAQHSTNPRRTNTNAYASYQRLCASRWHRSARRASPNANRANGTVLPQTVSSLRANHLAHRAQLLRPVPRTGPRSLPAPSGVSRSATIRPPRIKLPHRRTAQSESHAANRHSLFATRPVRRYRHGNATQFHVVRPAASPLTAVFLVH